MRTLFLCACACGGFTLLLFFVRVSADLLARKVSFVGALPWLLLGVWIASIIGRVFFVMI